MLEAMIVGIGLGWRNEQARSRLVQAGVSLISVANRPGRSHPYLSPPSLHQKGLLLCHLQGRLRHSSQGCATWTKGRAHFPEGCAFPVMAASLERATPLLRNFVSGLLLKGLRRCREGCAVVFAVLREKHA
jgi:hypothetical protein